MLRLTIGVFLRVVVLVLTGVEVVVGSTFSVSESISSTSGMLFRVLVTGAISLPFLFVSQQEFWSDQT